MNDEELYVVAEANIADPLRAEALRASIALRHTIFRGERIDDDDVEDILVIAERLHNWLRAEPGA